MKPRMLAPNAVQSYLSTSYTALASHETLPPVACLCLFVCCCLCPWHLGAWVLGGGDRGDVALSDVRLNHTCPSIHTLPVLPGLVPVFSARRAELVAPSCIFVL